MIKEDKKEHQTILNYEETKKDTGVQLKDKMQETLTEFEHRVAQAQLNGERHIEASREIIDYFNKNHRVSCDNFSYRGLRVFETGKTQEILDREEYPMNKRLHGDQEATLV